MKQVDFRSVGFKIAGIGHAIDGDGHQEQRLGAVSAD